MILFLHQETNSYVSQLNDRNEAGILTARKDLDYIGREELLEALKRVSSALYLPAGQLYCNFLMH